jgi:hypothetical protein
VSEGWRVVRCSRESFFDVIEFWLENRLMIELLTPEMASQYLAFTKTEKLQEFFATAANKSSRKTKFVVTALALQNITRSDFQVFCQNYTP